MLRFSGEMEHGNVRDGNEMRSAMVPIRVDARKADGRRKSRKRDTVPKTCVSSKVLIFVVK